MCRWWITPQTDPSIEQIQKESLDVLVPVHEQQGTWVLSVRVLAGQLNSMAGLPGVVNIEPAPGKHKHDEVQDQIIAGALDAVGTGPPDRVIWPGWRDWVFRTNSLDYPIVDVTDDGIDDGNLTPQHPDFYFLGDPAPRLTGWPITPIGQSTRMADSLAGHGTLNASIVAGYNQRSGPAYEDGSGYNYGLGVNPFGRVAGSQVFNNDGNWDLPGDNYAGLLGQAYTLGARINSNSWGSDTKGAYTTDDQAYDGLVRDALESQAGIQAMILVFSAGNNGSAASSRLTWECQECDHGGRLRKRAAHLDGWLQSGSTGGRQCSGDGRILQPGSDRRRPE